jgi:hypothetical protein
MHSEDAEKAEKAVVAKEAASAGGRVRPSAMFRRARAGAARAKRSSMAPSGGLRGLRIRPRRQQVRALARGGLK